MPNLKHLERLKQSVTKWNQWRKVNFTTKPDLSKANLRGADLSKANLIEADFFRADLSRADLGEANLSGTNLRKANLSRAILSRAILNGAILSEADLSRAILIEADLSGADLGAANLIGADLSGANLRGADLSKAILSDATLIETILSDAILSETTLSGKKLSEAILNKAVLSEANLNKANLLGANLIGVILSKAELIGADLSEANLVGANLSESNLSESNLNESNLNGANLSEANLNGANLIEADLSGADLGAANLIGADLSRANLSKARIREANLRGANLSGANLRGADLSEADLSEANLSGTNLSEATLVRVNFQGSSLGTAQLINANLDGSNLTEARLWEIQRAGWSIKGVICESVYLDEKGNKLEIFGPGDFERLYSEKTRVQIKYPGGISILEMATLPALIQHLEALHPGAKLRFESIQDASGAAVVNLFIDDEHGVPPERIEEIRAAIQSDAEQKAIFLRQELEGEKRIALLLKGEVRALERTMNKLLLNQKPNIFLNEGDFKMGDTYNIGQAGAVGPNAHTHDLTFNQIVNQLENSVDLAALAKELSEIRQTVSEKQDPSPHAAIAMEKLAEAEIAAQSGNASKVVEHLKAAGQWALGFAKELGKDLAIEAIKQSMGMK